VHVLKISQSKFDARVIVGIFIGYSKASKAYRVFLPESEKVIITTDTKFNELASWN
jgi:hypothetical protein